MKQERAKPLSGSFFPKKSFGQNFLINEYIRNKIIEACELKNTDTVLEIGPGQGALTKEIAPKVQHLYVVEKDWMLAEELRRSILAKNFTLFENDILKFSLSQLPTPLKVIGNLPYNIASPIIEKIIENRKQCTTLFMTIQLEHGKRLTAQPGCKDYGALTCLVQYFCETKLLFKINNTAFSPIPKVQSCFVRLHINSEPRIKAKNEKLLFELIKTSFQQRRKNVLNSMNLLIKKNELEDILNLLKLKTTLRAENLTLRDFIAISDKIEETRV